MRILFSALFFFVGFSVNAKIKDVKKAKQQTSLENPLLKEWIGPYGGTPPFDKVEIKHFRPALDKVIAQFYIELKKISDLKATPTFENTIEALEVINPAAQRLIPIYGVWSGNLNTSQFQKIQSEYAPKLAALGDAFVQDSALFKRIESIYLNRRKSGYNPEQIRLIELQYKSFIKKGAKLSSSKKKKVAAINQKLATLSNDFSDKILKDEQDQFILIKKNKDLAGLTPSLINSYAAEANRREHKGFWAIANTRSSAEPFLTSSSVRPLREKVFKMWSSRGDSEKKTNTDKLISKIVRLRTKRSKILGFPSYAHWSLTNTMAKTPEATLDLMMKVWKPALKKAKEEVKDMQALVDKKKGGFKIKPWDYRFYAEQVRKEKFDLDINSLKPYMQLENITKAMFWTAKKLFGLQFKKVENVPVFHPEVTVYKVLDSKNKFVGLWYFDPFARAGKRSGAWMTSYRDQNDMDNKSIAPLVSNNSNFIKGKKGEPVLISWDDAVTMFHEFGHALHGLSSKVTYPSLSGTNVLSDYAEFPSQILENFLSTKEVLRFLVNSKGQRIPKKLLTKLQKAKTFNQGFSTVEFLASAIVDMKLHLVAGRKNINPKSFEKKILNEIGMPSEIVMRHRLPHFNHLFAGEGYAAGYYGYLWAQVLEKDAFEAFSSAKNTFDKKTAKRLKDYIFSAGNTIDPNEAYLKFRGRDAKVDALLRARGFL